MDCCLISQSQVCTITALTFGMPSVGNGHWTTRLLARDPVNTSLGSTHLRLVIRTSATQTTSNASLTRLFQHSVTLGWCMTTGNFCFENTGCITLCESNTMLHT